MPLHDQVICGDSREVLTTLPDGCCDALVTDPPAGIGMMNLQFDHNRGGRDQWIAWLAGIMAEARRCIRPGGYALVWALPRTSHWTGLALEEAGFALRDQISHLFGSGFPKSQSCLKPAHEVWWLAKAPGPLQPLHIDACRVPTGESLNGGAYAEHGARRDDGWGMQRVGAGDYHQPSGRWPPNTLLSHIGGPDGCQPAGVRRVPADKRGQGRPRGTFPHSDDAWGHGHRAYTGAETAGDGTEVQQDYLCHPQCPIRLLDEQAGPRASGVKKPHHRRHAAKGWSGPYADDQGGPAFRSLTGGDTGACSRFFTVFPQETPDPENAVPFFYAPKAPRSERRLADGTPTGHPTQKPADTLMRWLVRLVTPPGGVVLDCFGGSGSTGVAAVREGMRAIIIEQDAHYVSIAKARISHAHEQAIASASQPVQPHLPLALRDCDKSDTE